MGFGVVKGFATRIIIRLTSVLLQGGGGQVANTETALTSSVAVQYGGGQASLTETALTETAVLASGSYP